MTIINGHEIAGRMPQFTKENRQANRDGRKTMTRRISGMLKVINRNPNYWHCDIVLLDGTAVFNGGHGYEITKIKCPYRVGDIRVMREPIHKGQGVDYAFYSDTKDLVQPNNDWPVLKWRWKRDTLPQMFMPYEAARSLCEITGIGCGRVQDISEVDAIAEGVERHWDDGVWYYGPLDHGHASAIYEFQQQWDSIHGPGAWERNDWVWIYSYKRCEEES